MNESDRRPLRTTKKWKHRTVALVTAGSIVTALAAKPAYDTFIDQPYQNRLNSEFSNVTCNPDKNEKQKQAPYGGLVVGNSEKTLTIPGGTKYCEKPQSDDKKWITTRNTGGDIFVGKAPLKAIAPTPTSS